MKAHPHISEQFDAELEQARNLLMEMGGTVEQQLRNACQALTTHDTELVQTVRDAEDRVNQLEIDLDELCVHIIALRQPAATDLRTLIGLMKASTDLERIGDEAERIAKVAKAVSHLPFPDDQYNDIRVMGATTSAMLSKALDVFARVDADQALAVIASDERVDADYDAIVRQRGQQMSEHPAQIERALNVIWAARALERIGDHAKNISEYAVFLAKGEDVRHGNLTAEQTPSD
tara:strand:- start:1686 stop:2387 length:702 start_codon:yes stop_codon:yes gene_type:complete